MYNVKDCLKRLKQMHKWKVLNEKVESQNKKFSTENERYNAIYEEILKCSSQERDNLEVLLECEKGTAIRFIGFKGLVTVFISVVSVIISIGSSFIIKLIDTSAMAGNSDLLVEQMGDVLGLAGGIAILAIIIYAALDIYGGRSLSRTTYLLGVLEKVKNQSKKGK